LITFDSDWSEIPEAIGLYDDSEDDDSSEESLDGFVNIHLRSAEEEASA